MCKFCDEIFNEKDLILDERTTSSADNSCEFLSPDGSCCECKGSEKCVSSYTLRGMYDKNDGEHWIGVGYNKKVGDFEIDSISEIFPINFCPSCGKELSKKLISDDYIVRAMSYDNKIEDKR